MGARSNGTRTPAPEKRASGLHGRERNALPSKYLSFAPHLLLLIMERFIGVVLLGGATADITVSVGCETFNQKAFADASYSDHSA